MKLPPFTLHRTRSLREATDLLGELGDLAAPYSGGTELLLAMKLGLASYEHLVDLKGAVELRRMDARNGLLRVGAGLTHHELETSPMLRQWCPDMIPMLAQVANLRVRAVGTLGGNLCFADPHSDPATFLMALGAVLVCERGEDERRVPAAQFHTGPYLTVLEPGEVLAAVDLPALPHGSAVVHLRMKMHERPSVTVAARMRVDRGIVAEAALVVGSVGPIPVDVDTSALLGSEPGDLVDRVSELATRASESIDPLPDGDGSSDYKRHLTTVYARRALLEAYRIAADRA